MISYEEHADESLRNDGTNCDGIGNVNCSRTSAILPCRGSRRLARHRVHVSARAHIITIRRLLNHTAGVPEFVASSEFAQRLAEDVTPGQVVALFFHDSLDFNPGDKWSYSNTDYLLLGMIIEKVTGEPYANVLQQDLFRPLGLRQTS